MSSVAEPEVIAPEPELRVTLDLSFEEADALRAWLLKATAGGSSALDEPLVNVTLTQLGRALDTIRATVNVRQELRQAGLEVDHLSDEQVRELGRRISDAALPAIRV